ncbi:MAG: hypothetical protein ACKO3T_24250 [Planctomycetaceae bacterium]
MDLFRILMGIPIFQSILRPVLRPASRLILGLIAVPLFRFLLRRIFRIQQLDRELEKDLQEWFRGSLLLLAATANMEHILFGWLVKIDWLDRADWLTMGLRLLMVIGVIQTMPDQELFAVLHPGPPKLQKNRGLLPQLRENWWPVLRGHLCRHINKSSPVLAMMCAIVGARLPEMPTESVAAAWQQQVLLHQSAITWNWTQQIGNSGPVTKQASLLLEQRLQQSMTEQFRLAQEQDPDLSRKMDLSVVANYLRLSGDYRRDRERWAVGWICYLAAIIQYLIIGLITSRDKALNVLSEFDRAVAERRRALIEEFSIHEPHSENKKTNGLRRDDRRPLF